MAALISDCDECGRDYDYAARVMDVLAAYQARGTGEPYAPVVEMEDEFACCSDGCHEAREVREHLEAGGSVGYDNDVVYIPGHPKPFASAQIDLGDGLGPRDVTWERLVGKPPEEL